MGDEATRVTVTSVARSGRYVDLCIVFSNIEGLSPGKIRECGSRGGLRGVVG